MSQQLLPGFDPPGPGEPEPPRRIPPWFHDGSTAPAFHVGNVLKGLHPFGRELHYAAEQIGARCGNCRHLVVRPRDGRGGGSFYKCALTPRQTHGGGTDLARRWFACSSWEPNPRAAPPGDLPHALAERTGIEAAAVLADWLLERGEKMRSTPRSDYIPIQGFRGGGWIQAGEEDAHIRDLANRIAGNTTRERRR